MSETERSVPAALDARADLRALVLQIAQRAGMTQLHGATFPGCAMTPDVLVAFYLHASEHILRAAGGWVVNDAIMANVRAEAAAASMAAQPAQAPAARDVLAERARQIGVEGWTPEHDDKHPPGELAKAAACYAIHEPDFTHVPSFWPWGGSWWKPGDPRRNLVKAAALILAEIERLDRAAARAGTAGATGAASGAQG